MDEKILPLLFDEDVCKYVIETMHGYSRDNLFYNAEMSNEKCRAIKEKFGNIEIPDCLTVIQRNGNALEYVGKQTPELCLAAVRQTAEAYKYVKEPTTEFNLAAIKQNYRVLQYISDQTKELCLAAIQQDYRAIQYVKKQTEELCLAAIR